MKEQPQADTQSVATEDASVAKKKIELPSGLDSGDIVVFNRRCMGMPPAGAALCIVSKIFSNSRWDHVGIVIRHPATGELLFLEADFGGVKLRSLEERVTRSSSNEIAVRRLSVVRNDSMREKLYAFALEMLGRPYEIGTGSVMMRVADPVAKQERERLHALLIDKRAQVEEITKELDTAALTTFQRRLLQSERDRVQNNVHQIHNRLMKELDADSDPDAFPEDYLPGQGSDLSRVFCSELVAAAYQRVGLLESYPPPFSYNPKDFSTEQKSPPGVHLLKAARLSDELYLRRSSRSPIETVRETKKQSFRGISEEDKPSREAQKLIRDALKRTPLFEMVPDEYKRSHLIKSFRARIVEQGDVVFEQGDYGDRLYVIGAGKVERFMSKSDEDPIRLSTMGPRTSFGLTAFTFNSPRVSTIRAKERTLLWEVDRATFELFKDTSHDVKSIISNADTRALRRILQNHFLFSRLDKLGPSEMNPFFLVKFRAGEEVFKQGEAGDNFYIIKKGELERHIRHPKRARPENGDGRNGWRNGGRNGTRNGRNGRGSSGDSRHDELDWNDEEQKSLAKTLKAGQSFGELSLMYNAPRAATVRARTDAECWAISTESFLRLNLGSGTQYLRAVFKKNASVERDGESYMTPVDLLRFADAEAFPSADRERLSALLVSLVASNREKDPIALHKRLRQRRTDAEVAASTADDGEGEVENVEEEEEEDDILMDFWEFVRFDIVLNQPAAEMDFAFRLADQDNSGFIGLDEMESLLQVYADVDDVARQMLSEELPTLKKVFGRGGRRTLSADEFQSLSKDILPPTFRRDVATLTYHMLNMEVGADDATRAEELYEMSFVEPDGSPSVLGSQFMTSARGAAASRAAEWMERAGAATHVDWGHLLSVGVSGAASRTAVAPLERLKILMQTGGREGFSSGAIAGLRSMVRQDDGWVRALFRGNGANVLRIVPNAALQLVIVEKLHGLVKGHGGVGEDRERVSGGTRSRAVEAVLIGGIAGMVGAAATYPLDFIRGRLTVQRGEFQPYRGVIHGLGEAVGHEGVRSMYRGLVPTLAGVFPYVGLSFAMYETLRPMLPRKNDGSGVPTTGSSIVCGAVASATGQMAAFPLDTCRRRMQVAGFIEGNGIGRGVKFSEMWKGIWSELGVGGFFRGGLVNVVKVAPASAVSFLVYERVRGGYERAEDTLGRAGVRRG